MGGIPSTRNWFSRIGASGLYHRSCQTGWRGGGAREKAGQLCCECYAVDKKDRPPATASGVRVRQLRRLAKYRGCALRWSHRSAPGLRKNSRATALAAGCTECREGLTNEAVVIPTGSGQSRQDRPFFFRLVDTHGSRRRGWTGACMSGNPRHDIGHPEQRRHGRLRAVRRPEGLDAILRTSLSGLTRWSSFMTRT
jgi:hypothetical protein